MTPLASVHLGAATIGTLVGVAVIVAALAFYLINISLILQHVSFTVGTVLIGVRAIAAQTAPLNSVVRDLVSDVQAIDDELQGLLGGGGAARDRRGRRAPARR